MNAKVFITASGQYIRRAECIKGKWQVEIVSDAIKINCLEQNPTEPHVIFAGTVGQGILISQDTGKTWQKHGLDGITVKSIAISRSNPDKIYAGTKPPALYSSEDAGKEWNELESLRQQRRWFWFTPAEAGDPYVMGLTVSPSDENHIIAGIEYGAVLRSIDGGLTWSRHLSHTSRDCHNISFHSNNGNWIYEAGGGWPASVSSDAGQSWKQPRKGLRWSLYAMACAADPQDPKIWYLSAAPHAIFPELQKMPRGHWSGEANAFIFRMSKNGQWKRLNGGLPQPLDHMAYALVTDPHASGHLYAGLSNGDIWFTANYGDSWAQVPVNLEGIHYSLVMLTG